MFLKDYQMYVFVKCNKLSLEAVPSFAAIRLHYGHVWNAIKRLLQVTFITNCSRTVGVSCHLSWWPQEQIPFLGLFCLMRFY